MLGHAARTRDGVDNNEVAIGYAKGRAKRAQILGVAADLIGEVGYHKVSMAEIAARCGLSRPGLIHHFPTKASILETVLADLEREERERLTSVGDCGIAVMCGIVDSVERMSICPRDVRLFITLAAEATSPEHPANAYFRDRYLRVLDAARRALAQARDQGQLREGVDPVAAAAELVALIDGVKVHWLLDPAQVDMVGVVRSGIERLLTVPLTP